MKKSIAHLGLYMSGAMLLVMGFFTIGPDMETKFLPAYGRFEAVSIEPHGEGQSKVVFRFEKFRSCAPAGFAWFNGELGKSYQAVNYRATNPPGGSGMQRPPGFHTSNPYIIDVPPEDVRARLLGEIYSRCHPFWITRSEVYP